MDAANSNPTVAFDPCYPVLMWLITYKEKYVMIFEPQYNNMLQHAEPA